jgi:hypothetical protein
MAPECMAHRHAKYFELKEIVRRQRQPQNQTSPVKPYRETRIPLS